MFSNFIEISKKAFHKPTALFNVQPAQYAES